MALDLKELVKDCLGPLPRVCQEQVLLDLERARMTAEDYRQGNARCEFRTNLTWRRREDLRVLCIQDTEQTLKNIADVVKWHDNGEVDDLDCFEQIRAEVQPHGFLTREEESEPESDTVSDEEQEQEEEEGVHCETCDAYYRQGVVAWFTEPFTHNGRTLYSACGVCRWRLNLEDRPVLHW